MKYLNRIKLFLLGVSVSFSAHSALPDFNVSNPIDADAMFFFEGIVDNVNPTVVPTKINNKGDILGSIFIAESSVSNPNYFYSGTTGEIVAQIPAAFGGYALTDENIFLLDDVIGGPVTRDLLRCPIENIVVLADGVMDIDSSCDVIVQSSGSISSPTEFFNSRYSTSSGYIAVYSATNSGLEVHLYDSSNTLFNLGVVESGFAPASIFVNDNDDGSVSVFVAFFGVPALDVSSIVEYKLEADSTIAAPVELTLDGLGVEQVAISSNHQLVALREESPGALSAFTCNLLDPGSCTNLQPLDFTISVPVQPFISIVGISSKGFFTISPLNQGGPSLSLPSPDSWVVDYTEPGNAVRMDEIVQGAFSNTPNTIFGITVAEDAEKVVVLGATTSEDVSTFGDPSDVWVLDAKTMVNPFDSILIVTPESLLINSSNTASTNIDLQLNAQELFAIEVECTPSNDNITLSSRSAGSVFPAAPQSLLIDTTNLNENTFAQATSLSAFIDSDGNFVAAPEPITRSGIYASLVYNVQPVSGTTDVNCTAMGSDADGLPRTISVTNATITLDNGINPVDGNGQIVSGTVIIPLGVDPGSIVVTLTINDVSVTTTVDANGVFVFENIRMEDVTLSVEAPNAVAECTAATVGSEAVSTGDITVYRGDINNDGTIDIADFTFLSSRFGLSEGENRFRARADLNKDGVINVQDLAILGSALGLEACAAL